VCHPPPERIEAGRESSLALLSAIVSSSDDAIVRETTGGVITSWNQGAERMYGYRPEETLGQPVTMLCSPDRAGEIGEILDAVGRGEQVLHFETERRRNGGMVFPAAVTVSPIYDDSGDVVGASSISRDITQSQELKDMAELRRRAADLDRANQNLESFTYSVSHDLRAPLRAMNGFSEALLDDSARVAAQLQDAEPERDVRFVIERPVEARADPTLIRTVLENLIGNAWKFTSRREDAVIEFGTRPDEDARVCCYVRDNGAGFDPAYTDKLFQPFQRLHAAGEFPGTGIGLASVRQIMERHGGGVRAEGAVGRGAIFYLTLDAKEMP
jgi:PAS domain S-box-containing protein